MLHLWRILLLSLLLSDPAFAGPWSRVEGGVFLSLSTEHDRDANRYSSLYGEYGLSPRNTLGFELGHSNAGESSLMLWWQRAMDHGDGPNRWTLSSGMGMLQRDGAYMPLAQIGAAWGRGFDTLPGLRHIPGGGWVGVDVRIKVAGAMKDQAEVEELAANGAGMLAYITPETTAKTELTLGWHATDTLMLINQFRFEERDDTGLSSKFAVSVVHDLWGPAKMELGLIAPLSGPGEQAVKLGTWLEF